MIALFGLIVCMMVAHMASHALTYRSGTAWDKEWSSYSGVAVGLIALAVAFVAGARWP